MDEKDNTINVCEFSHDGDKFVLDIYYYNRWLAEMIAKWDSMI